MAQHRSVASHTGGRRIKRAAIAAGFLLVLMTSPAHAEVEEAEHYESLRALTMGADAVVLGTVVTVEPGRVFSGCGYAAATLRVEALVAGALPPAAQDRLTIEYFGFCDALPRLGVEIPRERGVYFLRNKGQELRIVQPDAAAMAVEAESKFWRTVILAGTVVDRDGSVHVPETLNASFLAGAEGTSFAEFVASVRALAVQPEVEPPPSAESGAIPGPIIILMVGCVVVLSLIATGSIARGIRRNRG